MYRRCLLLFAAGVLVAGCDDASSPDGSDSTVAIRAFVDANGSGSFDSGDVPLSGLSIKLQATSFSAEFTATTDAQGLATFAGVAPGSYAASLSGAPPAGAVLSSAEHPVVVAPFDGGAVSGEFRFAWLPGSVTGVLYRDNDGNGQYDAGVDTPAPGLPVALLPALGGEALAETVTSAAGAFSFSGLRPGAYRVAVTPLPTMTLLSGDTMAVTVGPQAPTSLPVVFTGNLITTITEVRTQPKDAAVAFEGVVTVSPMILSTNPTGQQVYVQDASGAGILVFYGSTPTDGVQQGDSVRVVGTIDLYGGEKEVVRPTVTRLGTGTVPMPRVVTAQQLAASMADGGVQGQLVTVQRAVVTSVSGSPTSTAYNVTVQVDTALLTVRVSSGNVGIAQTFWQVGSAYDVTGLLGAFSNAPQLKPRSAADVKAASSATPIGTLRARAFADSAGTRLDTVVVEGVVHTAQGTFRNDNAFIQDPTGGILLYNVPSSAALAVGDSVQVRALVDWFNGELELVRFSSSVPPVISKLGTGAPPRPRDLSGAQVLSRQFEGQLVRIGNVVLDSVGVPSSSGGYTAWVITPDGARLEVRIEKTAIGIAPESWVKGNAYHVVGALSHYRGTAQIKPRDAADVTAATAGVISIAAAEQRALNDTVLVEGVVIAPVGIFGSASGSSTNAYIQDATGGIQIFGVPASVTLDVGDLVRVRGLMGAYSGELQIARFSSSSLLEITELGTSAPPAPRAVSGADVAARTYEGELVLLAGATVTAVGTVSSSGGYNVTMTAADGTQITVRHDRAAVSVPVDTWVVGAVYDVTGVPTAFNSTPQVKVRGIADVVRR